MIKTRFAPSPTGLMHFGNLRAALFNYLYTKHHQGVFVLRIEDTDAARSEKIYQEAILKDLQWLGLDWQEGPFYQSERQAIYHEYYETLEGEGLTYACFCSEEQLELTRKVQMASGQPPRYPGTCLGLTEAEKQKKIEAGMPYTLRFKIPKNEIIEFEDLIKGKQRFETNHIGDFIIQRQDKTAPFMFCNAIDDARMGITHTLRGDDHLTNTPRQILIMKSLHLYPPQYGHFPTILGPDSRPLSKRNGSRSIQELRTEGYAPLAILNYLARLGHSMPELETTLLSLESLALHFDLNRVSKSPAHYDAHQLEFWQKETMHRCTVDECWTFISPFVEGLIPADKIKAFVETIQPNLTFPKEAEFWAEAIFSDPEELAISQDILPLIREAGSAFFITASELLTPDAIDYKGWIDALQQKTGKRGKSLFHPLRAALTTVLHGPELARVLMLIGPDKARIRLLKAAHHATHL